MAALKFMGASPGETHFGQSNLQYQDTWEKALMDVSSRRQIGIRGHNFRGAMKAIAARAES